MDDAIAVYREASEANDLDRLLPVLAPDCEVVSPISGRMVFRGTKDLRVLLGITGTPSFSEIAKIDCSIPQYNVGYQSVKELVRKVETTCPGLFFAGSFNHGISVSDCIAGGTAAAEKVALHLEAVRPPVRRAAPEATRV